MRRASLALISIALLPLAGCGDSGHDRVPPERMLEQAAAHPIRSAQVDVDATLRLDGSALSEPLHLHLEGPYVSGGQVAIPSFDWRLNASALGFPVGGRLVSTGENVYLSVYGNQYEVGEQAVSDANDRISAAAAGGLLPDLRSWLASPRVAGEGSDGGVDCEKIAGRLRGDEIARDLGALTGELGSAQPGISGRAEACVGFDDRLLHGLDLDADVTLPGRGAAHVQADIEISDVGSSQRITAPRGPHRPIRDLLLTLNDLGVPIPLG